LVLQPRYPGTTLQQIRKNEESRNFAFLLSQSNLPPADYHDRKHASNSRLQDDVLVHNNPVSQFTHLPVHLTLAFSLLSIPLSRPVSLPSNYTRPHRPSTLTIEIQVTQHSAFASQFTAENHTNHDHFGTPTRATKTSHFRFCSLAHCIKSYFQTVAPKESQALAGVNIALWTAQQ
jgi:hypothetical protein